jgi:Sulfotransferase family
LNAKQQLEHPDPATEPGMPFNRHVEHRTVVLPQLRVVYLPIPKAGWTSVLWLLSELEGIPEENFSHSVLPGVSPALTIHDMALWGPGHRLADYTGDERERILTEDGWFRFSVVRDPAPRLWSAWQSKLLLREPRFVSMYGEEPWFPRIPDQPSEVIDDFRRFVAAVAGGEAVDVHWAAQHDLVQQVPLQHVGRLESLDDTLGLLRVHLVDHPWPSEARHDNRTPLRLPAAAFDTATAAAINEHYAADFKAYGYGRVEPADDDADWEASAAPLLPMVRETIDRHVRIRDLHRMAKRANIVEGWLETSSARNEGRSRSPVLTNLEEQGDFNVRWAWADGRPEPGFTAVVRARNEARTLPSTLPPLLRAARLVVLVDNGSTDGTADVAREAARQAGAEERLEIRSYPFAVARCGEEHLSTPANSLHSLVYFYNWSFSHVRTRYALKWDADMVLTETGTNALRDLEWQLEAADAVVKIPRYPLYVADEQRAFLDLGLANCEAWGWPNGPGYSFVKALEWEQPLLPPEVPRIILPDFSCIELKHLDADEFDHWSDTRFDLTARTQRKRREWEIFHALADGGEPASDLVSVEAPEGEHVIDYVRTTWLPEHAATLPGRAERILERLIA